MKVKTSITLSQELLRSMNELGGSYGNRSQLLEKAAWSFLAQLRREEQAARDLKILNRRAKYLNGEVQNALAYQVPL